MSEICGPVTGIVERLHTLAVSKWLKPCRVLARVCNEEVLYARKTYMKLKIISLQHVSLNNLRSAVIVKILYGM